MREKSTKKDPGIYENVSVSLLQRFWLIPVCICVLDIRGDGPERKIVGLNWLQNIQ